MNEIEKAVQKAIEAIDPETYLIDAIVNILVISAKAIDVSLNNMERRIRAIEGVHT